MVAQTEIEDFYPDVLNGVHNLNSDTIKVALSNTAPGSETSDPTGSGNGQLSNVTEIAYTNLSGGTQPTIANTAVTTPVAGTARFDGDDVEILASGGTLPDWRYAYIYNDTATNDELISVIDVGETVSLADGESRTLQFAATGIVNIGQGTIS